ncbi:MAG: hypothetical protein KDD82_11010 [Planctomycetes bacterium]|nr:hypothetical protein [Planctomycetota bacterium]
MGLFRRKSESDMQALDSDEAEVEQAEAPPPKPTPRPVLRQPAPGTPYGIDRAIALMRTLPRGNVEVIVQVVKATLESNDVEVKAIIADATRRQEELRSNVDARLAEISDLESKVARLKREIEEFEALHAEVSMVKERLILAEELSASHPRTESGRIVIPTNADVVGFASDNAEDPVQVADAREPVQRPVSGQRRRPRS